jgi:hypothetical protein
MYLFALRMPCWHGGEYLREERVVSCLVGASSVAPVCTKRKVRTVVCRRAGRSVPSQ